MNTPALPGHPHLAYRPAGLFLENVRLADLADEHGTPLFVYSKSSMLDALAAYQKGFTGRKVQICYAVKANPALCVLQVFAEAGCGFDIVSLGELERVLAVGAAADKIIFSGVGKTRTEMRAALDAGIGCFNVESEAELEVLSEVALSMGMRAPVSLRVNPDVDPKTHPYISTGLKNSKFGIAHARVVPTYRSAATLAGVRVMGIDCHIGSQITQEEPYLEAVERMMDLVQAVEASGVPIGHIDFGGGLGINYNGEAPPGAQQLWTKLMMRLDARGFGRRKLMIEPGRSLVGNAGVCVTEVLYLKPGEQKSYCVVDAAMNDLPRPAMYQAYHGIVPLQPRSQAQVTWQVVGPVCESGDWIGHDRALALEQGDRLAVLSAGAFCMSMASNYNSRGRAPEVLVDGERSQLIRRRETFADQISTERLVAAASLDRSSG